MSRLRFWPCFKSLTSVTLDSNPSLFPHLTYQCHLTSMTNLDSVYVSSDASAGFLLQDTSPMDQLSQQTVVNYVSPPFWTILTPKLWYPIWLIIARDIASTKSLGWCLDLTNKNYLCYCHPFIYVKWHNPFLSFCNIPYFRFHTPSIVLHFSYPSVRLDSQIAGYVGFAIVQPIGPPSFADISPLFSMFTSCDTFIHSFYFLRT